MVRRILQRLTLTLLAVAGAVSFLLVYPEPLYAHHTQAGRLHLYSDHPFPEDSGRAVLTEVERRLAHAPAALQDPHSTYRIFVANEPWRKRLSFLWSYGAGGINYYPIAHSVFLREADIEHDRLLRTDGTAVPAPRTLAYYATHEITHTLIGKRVGAIGNWRLPVWIREGVADYVGFDGQVDIEALTRQLRANDRELNPQLSGLYARYRLLVAHMLTREHWTMEQLLTSDLPITAAERKLLGE